MIEFYVDGSSRAKDQTGGFGVVAFKESKLIHAYQEQSKKVTNNQMELAAILYACQYADKEFPQEEVIIYSDSAYCVNAINIWMVNWARNQWINSKKEPVKNQEQMKQLWKLFSQDFYHCGVAKVKGHDECLGNELADALATCNESKFRKLMNENKVNISYVVN